MNITYITSNSDKAKRFNKNVGFDLKFQALDIPEIQSLSLDEVVDCKARSAFASVGAPVIVEDVSFVIKALGKLPGPFIKFFLASMSLEQICSLVPENNRAAYSEVAFAYFDGSECKIMKCECHGHIPDTPRGTGGFGFDSIFIPDGLSVTAAELPEEEYEHYYPTHFKPFEKLRSFLTTLEHT